MNVPGMSHRGKVLFLVVAGLCVGLLVAVFGWIIGQMRSAETVGQSDNPFVFLVSPTYEAAPEQLAWLSSRMSAEAGFAVAVRRAEDSETAIVAAGASKVDAWLLPVFDYLFCREEYQVEAGVQVLREGDSRTYRGEIVVRADSGITTLGGLSGRRVAFVDPYSTSGFLYPARLLIEARAAVVPVFAGSHQAALAALRDGKVDGAAIYERMAEAGLRVVATTSEIPNEPIFFRTGVSAELRRRFIDALGRMAADPRGGDTLRTLGGITGFTPVTDGAYADVHREIDAAGKQLQDLVPRGWGVYRENRQPAIGGP